MLLASSADSRNDFSQSINFKIFSIMYQIVSCYISETLCCYKWKNKTYFRSKVVLFNQKKRLIAKLYMNIEFSLCLEMCIKNAKQFITTADIPVIVEWLYLKSTKPPLVSIYQKSVMEVRVELNTRKSFLFVKYPSPRSHVN